MSDEKPTRGQKFAHLTILRVHRKKAHTQQTIDCQCDCGRIITINWCGFKRHQITSCRHKDCEYRQKELEEKELNVTPAIVQRLKPIWHCRRPETACALSESCNICCAECDKRICTMRCKNTPEKCGGAERRKK